MKKRSKYGRAFIPSGYQKKAAFTIMELLVALTLSTFLVLLLYRVYAQVLDVYRLRSRTPLKEWFLLSESLQRQLAHLSAGQGRPFFLFKEGKLLFLTSGGYSGGTWLVGFFPEKEKQRVLYFEKPYLNSHLPADPEELLNEENERNLYELPYFELHLYKIRDKDNKEALEEVRALSDGVYALEMKARGFERVIYFSFGRMKNCW